MGKTGLSGLTRAECIDKNIRQNIQKGELIQ
jgi:hypothetical protein